MTSTSHIHCRLCAELKPSEKLLDLVNDANKCIDILEKLSYLNAIYVDLTDDTIPKTICFVCCEQLEKAYDFLYKVQKAQTVLKNIFNKEDLKSDSSCDERDSRISPEPENITSEKSTPLNVKNLNNDSNIGFSQLDIKNEPKEENEIVPNSETLNLPSKNVSQNLDVHEILNASIFENSIEGDSENIVWYGKELTNDKNLWKDYTWLCSHCKMEFGDLYVLRSHTKEVHKKCCAFACADCFVKQDSFKDFIDHVRKHRKILR
ncbi:hypothetical protein EVAR_64391_1 [Eumeta japonica]|uniref:ZAD domain-containing protein n=1 Tax=Eumeta variegata TaxID=151549 RepID=A0A4C1SJ20_EUMVA|nr:hypothetical protein EVAR_64391_1 [Eumeta japonica]